MSIEREGSHDDTIEALLREVGGRSEPSADSAESVRAALHAEWQAMLAEQRQKRRRVIWSVAASLACAVLIGTLATRFSSTPAVEVAQLARIDGHLLAASNDEWQARAAGEPVYVGEALQTDDRSRAALTLPDGVSVRLDRNTFLRLEAPQRLALRSGAVYVDVPPGEAASSTLTIETRAGSIRHIGTQYVVQAYAPNIEVSVREGRVLIRNDAGTTEGSAGESLHVTVRGEITRAFLTAQDERFDWVSEISPPFDIDDAPLATFLEWVARESGRHIAYASDDARAAAHEIRLRGSIAGLDIDTALQAVLSTTALRTYAAGPDTIGLALGDSESSVPSAQPER